MKQEMIHMIDPDPLFSRKLQEFLQSLEFETVVYPRATDFLVQCDFRRPGCLISEIRIPDITGAELLRHVMMQEFPLPVIFLTAFGDVRTAVEYVKNGAFHFLDKRCSQQTLWETIQGALKLDARNRDHQRKRKQYIKHYHLLTPREKQVLEMIYAGNSNKQMAAQLEISVKTIEYYRKKVMHTLQANSLAHLIRIVHIVQQDTHWGLFPQHIG